MLSFARPLRRVPSALSLALRLLFAFCGLLFAGIPASAQTAEPITITFEDLELARAYTGQNQNPVSWSISPGTVENYTYKVTYNGKAALPKNAGKYTVKVVATEKVVAEGLKKKRTATASGVFYVNKVPITVVADDAGRFFGAANPKFTLFYHGFVNGETFAVLDKKPVATTPAKTTSPVGDYPIEIVGGSDLNYEVAHRQPGTLTVSAFASGQHEALILGELGGAPQGKIEITLPTKGGAFSGRLHLASHPLALAFKGVLVLASDNFSATTLVTLQQNPKNGTPFRYLLRVTVDVDAPSGVILTLEKSEFPYEFADSFGEVAPVAKVRVHHKTTNIAPWAGAHTLLLDRPVDAGDGELRPIPAGSSYATATIALDGTLALRGKLSDGTTLTANFYSDGSGAYRVFVRPYGTRLESRLSGLLALTPHPQLVSPARYWVAGDGSTTFHWTKAPNPGSKADAIHPRGFGPVAVLASLDPWLPPVIKKNDPANTTTLAQRLDLANTSTEEAIIDLYYGMADYGDSAFDLPQSATLAPNGAITPVLFTDKNITGWKMSVNATNGTFSGSFVLSDTFPKVGTRKVAFQGILRQVYDGSSLVGSGFALVKPIAGDALNPDTTSANIELSGAFGGGEF